MLTECHKNILKIIAGAPGPVLSYKDVERYGWPKFLFHVQSLKDDIKWLRDQGYIVSGGKGRGYITKETAARLEKEAKERLSRRGRKPKDGELKKMAKKKTEESKAAPAKKKTEESKAAPAKKKAAPKKGKYKNAAAMYRELIMSGKYTDKQIFTMVKKSFPKKKSNQVSFYRWELGKSGKKVPARKVAKK